MTNLIEQVQQNLESVGLNMADTGFDLAEAVGSTISYMLNHGQMTEEEIQAPGITAIIEELAFGSNLYEKKLLQSAGN